MKFERVGELTYLLKGGNTLFANPDEYREKRNGCGKLVLHLDWIFSNITPS